MQALFEDKPWTQRLRVIFWLVIIAGAILVIVVLLQGAGPVIRNPQGYQAVFLDNGQVYFGHLKSAGRDYLSLTDIYYLRSGTLPAPPATGQGAPAAANPAVGTVDLIKLGAELHAPRDEMIINKAHVVYYEDLQESGEIVKLIRQHQAAQK